MFPLVCSGSSHIATSETIYDLITNIFLIEDGMIKPDNWCKRHGLSMDVCNNASFSLLSKFTVFATWFYISVRLDGLDKPRCRGRGVVGLPWHSFSTHKQLILCWFRPDAFNVMDLCPVFRRQQNSRMARESWLIRRKQRPSIDWTTFSCCDVTAAHFIRTFRIMFIELIERFMKMQSHKMSYSPPPTTPSNSNWVIAEMTTFCTKGQLCCSIFAFTPVNNDEKWPMYIFCCPPGLTTPLWLRLVLTTLVKKELSLEAIPDRVSRYNMFNVVSCSRFLGDVSYVNGIQTIYLLMVKVLKLLTLLFVSFETRNCTSPFLGDVTFWVCHSKFTII